MIDLRQGDCLEIMKSIPDESVDLILTDPPYGIDFRSNHRHKRYDKIQNDGSLDWLDDFVDECFRVLKNDTAAYFFCSWHNVDIFKQAIEKKFKIKNIIIWLKNNTSMGDLRGSYAPKYEMVIFAHKGRRLLEGYRFPDVIPAKRTGKKKHPTEKPVPLLELFVKNSSKEGDTVLDPFMGSGRTGVACLNTGRDFIGIELDETYFKTAEEDLNG